jgi:hypothetical protein
MNFWYGSRSATSPAYIAFRAAFNGPRDRRSDAYKAGALALLVRKLDGNASRLICPYPEGSAECDAWFAGVDEGHLIVRRQQRDADANCVSFAELKQISAVFLKRDSGAPA